jgi:hypothetical protein
MFMPLMILSGTVAWIGARGIYQYLRCGFTSPEGPIYFVGANMIFMVAGLAGFFGPLIMYHSGMIIR